MKKVVNAIILDKNGNRVLIIKRIEGIHSDKWAFPGGVVETGETEEAALEREIKEEIGIRISKIIKKMGEYNYLRENGEEIKGISFLVSIENEKINIDKSEIGDFRWATIEEIESLNCAPGIEEEAMKAIYEK
ncbi:MAG TPA: NUDIX hydrolase [Candidatus Nanoarchaeia archaeon]|nr:NUDIX hydrolase [Candidatus Nanoarchaeia archaeon]